MSKVALITGITGQDGSYLAELLISKGYKVHGIIRTSTLEQKKKRIWRIKSIINDLTLHEESLESYASLFKMIHKIKPDEVYHLAAQSYDGYSFQNEFYTFRMNIDVTHFMLSAIKDFSNKTRFFFAGSSEMFGNTKIVPQDEQTPFKPRSAYGISKVTSYHLAKNYREAYKLHASTGILFNHESPRRSFRFVTRKISYGVARIKKGLQKKIKLGNIQSKRDWGHAKDYVKAMWLMLQQDVPGDYVIGTGEENSVEKFLEKAFSHVGLNYRDHIEINNDLVRKLETSNRVANYSKAKRILKWKPEVSFNDLVTGMVESDLKFVTNNEK